MKKQSKKLQLCRETVHILTDESRLEGAQGGFTCSLLCVEDRTCDGCVTGDVTCF